MKSGVLGQPGDRALVFLALVSLFCAACRQAGPIEGTPRPSEAPQMGVLQLWSTPEGAQLRINGRASGQTPTRVELPAGKLSVELSRPGYDAWQGELVLAPAEVLLATATLRDSSPPQVRLSAVPPQVEQGAPLNVQASAIDNEAASELVLSIDGQRAAATAGQPLTYRWDTSAVAPGPHLLRIEARDRAGNIGASQTICKVVTPLPAATAPVEASPTARPQAVQVSRGSLTIPTYQYQRALHSASESPCSPYPVLDWAQVGPPVPVAYESVTLENEYLRLVFLPALGGRLYQCVFLPTGQKLFYNNPVLKPSHWGPPEMGWWLAAGGMEWCLPVDEHGYVTAEPWTVETTQAPDGSATITLAHTEQTHNIRAAVRVALSPGEARFTIATRLDNPDPLPKAYQYWLNAMVSLGQSSLSSATRFVLPATEVVVHSTGDSALGRARSTLPWPVANGRDLSHYDTWRNWLGVFVPGATAGYMGAYNPETDLGIARVFPRQRAPGVKLFAFGKDFDTAAYTDDGSQYAELWGGVTPTFWDTATLGPQESVQWSETWLPLHGLGGLAAASAEAALQTAWAGDELHLAVGTPGTRRVTVTLVDGQGELYRQAGMASPAQPLTAAVRPPRAITGGLTVRVFGEDGSLLAEHTLGPR